MTSPATQRSGRSRGRRPAWLSATGVAAVVLGGAALAFATSSWFALLARWLPALVALPVVLRALFAGGRLAGIELAAAGIAMVPVALVLTGRAAAGEGPPLLVLPTVLAAGTWVGAGLGLVKLNLAGSAGRAGDTCRRLALALFVLALMGTLYWGVVASGRGGRGVFELLSHAVFVAVFAVAAAPLFALAGTRAWRSAAALTVLALPGVAVLMPGGAGFYAGLVHVAVTGAAAVTLALPLLALVQVARGGLGAALVTLLGLAAALYVGADSLQDLWLKLRFAEGLSRAEVALRIGVPALALVGLLVPPARAPGASTQPAPAGATAGGVAPAEGVSAGARNAR